MHALVDDDPGTLPGCQASQVCQAHFGHEDVDVMFGVVNMADHRHHAGDRTALGDRLGHEHGQVCVAREVARAADAVHHPRAADVSGVDVAIDVELQCRVDADDAKAAHDFRVVGDLLRTQNQFVLVALQIAEHVGIAPARQGDRTARGKTQLARVDQVEGRVLQHLGIHCQVFERRVDQATHHRVGDGADTGL
ncbi:hypothetical protein D9M71_351840 [compost metagenome]